LVGDEPLEARLEFQYPTVVLYNMRSDSYHAAEQDAQGKLDQFDCDLPYVDAPEPLPGEDTVRLIKKPFNN
jgi:hypothetical protein